MFPIKNYYHACLEKELIGVKRDVAIKRLSNLLACHVVSKDTKESMHFRYFTCTEEYKPTDKWLGTIAIRLKNNYVVETALSVPK